MPNLAAWEILMIVLVLGFFVLVIAGIVFAVTRGARTTDSTRTPQSATTAPSMDTQPGRNSSS